MVQAATVIFFVYLPEIFSTFANGYVWISPEILSFKAGDEHCHEFEIFC